MSLSLLGNPPSVTMAGVSLPISQALVLTSVVDLSGDYDSLRRNGVAYQVPTGKKLQILAMRVNPTTAAAVSIVIGSADVSVASSNVAPTGYATISPGGGGNAILVTTATAGSILEQQCFYEIAASKYPTVSMISLPVAVFLCRLVNA